MKELSLYIKNEERKNGLVRVLLCKIEIAKY
jgi:hypothetical protein